MLVMFFRNPSSPASHCVQQIDSPPPTPVLHPHAGADLQPVALAKGRFQRWLESVGAAMERAEQRITDDFKVPPGGG
jgi:hypothetical protein